MKTHQVVNEARKTATLPIDPQITDRDGSKIKSAECGDEGIEMDDATSDDQAWFWTERWQTMEREADAEIAAGHVTVFEDVDAFIASLDA